MLRSSLFRVGTTALGAFLGCALFLLVVQLVPVSAGPPTATENGDINGDTSVDIGDAVALLAYLFSGGPAPVAIAGPNCPACALTDLQVFELATLTDAIQFSPGGLTISSPNSILLDAGDSMLIEAPVDVNISAGGEVDITAGNMVDANAPQIQLN